MKRRSFLSELAGFVFAHKAYLLIPVLLVLLLAGALILASGSSIAPYIYTLF
ncbi:MAG: hypothetical protein RIQ40_49 [Planctomycetota bacterium]|jgi:hypothetical protein|nr:DUF5989 family protein [Planctomycetaceae bacterium]